LTPVEERTLVSSADVAKIRAELERRRGILLQIANDRGSVLDPVERQHILDYLGRREFSPRPDNAVTLMREFVSSALSINQPPHRTRNRLKTLLGKIPLGNTIGHCLALLFKDGGFDDEANWEPAALFAFCSAIASRGDFSSDSFRRDVLTTMIECARHLQSELCDGLERFYARVDAATPAKDPDLAWRYLEQFGASIPGVGPVLTADFLKNIGFHRFVKIDQRLEKEFPGLLPSPGVKRKDLFAAAWELADALGMTPFELDHLLYQWGGIRGSLSRMGKGGIAERH
jgi:hypothetical protein